MDVVFENVNEEGQTYDTHSNLEDALRVLALFPNDTIVVSVKGDHA